MLTKGYHLKKINIKTYQMRIKIKIIITLAFLNKDDFYQIL